MPAKTLNSIENLLKKIRDERLVRLTLTGDSNSFNSLIGFYKKRVFAMGYSFFKNPDDVDDYVQEVFVKVYVNLPNFRFDSAFSTWLTRIAYTTAINAVNRRKQYAPLADEEMLQSSDLTPEEEHIRKVTMQVIRKEIENLPENYALCVEMYFFYDLSYDEISIITGYPKNTIKSHIFRAKKILSQTLRGYYEQ